MSEVSSEPARPRLPSPLGEVLLVFVVTTAATVVITFFDQALPGLAGYETLLIGGMFLVVAMKLAQREPGGMRRYGIDLAGMLTPPSSDDERAPGPLGLYDLARALRDAAPAALRESAVALAMAAVVFPPFALGFHFFYSHFGDLVGAGPVHAFRFSPPEDLTSFALTQLLVIALPEEMLFRGYVQTRLSERWPPRKILGVPLDVRVLLLQAALFAVLHYASIPHPARLAVFFPGLLFGVLRAWRGGIGAAMLLHAMSNVLAAFLERGWLT